MKFLGYTKIPKKPIVFPDESRVVPTHLPHIHIKKPIKVIKDVKSSNTVHLYSLHFDMFSRPICGGHGPWIKRPKVWYPWKNASYNLMLRNHRMHMLINHNNQYYNTNIQILATSLNHMKWAEITSTPCHSELEEVTSKSPHVTPAFQGTVYISENEERHEAT